MTRTPADDVHPVLPGCEAWSSPGGGPTVRSCCTASPAARSRCGPWRRRSAAGFAVELPRLPGHGTTSTTCSDRLGRLAGRGGVGARPAAGSLPRGRVVAAGFRWVALGLAGRASSRDRGRRRHQRADRPARGMADAVKAMLDGGTPPCPPSATTSPTRTRRAGVRRHASGPAVGLVEAGDELSAGRHPHARPRHEQPAGPCGPPPTATYSRGRVRPGRAGHARAQLPRGHSRLRQGRHRGACLDFAEKVTSF